MHYVYILRSLRYPRHLYTGYSTDIKGRLQSHNSGQSPHTSKYKPWEIEFLADFKSERKARAFEKYLKTSSGKAFRNKRLIGV